jgi:hypothetical protein
MKFESTNPELPENTFSIKYLNNEEIKFFRHEIELEQKVSLFYSPTEEEIKDKDWVKSYFNIIATNMRKLSGNKNAEFFLNTVSSALYVPEVAELWGEVRQNSFENEPSINEQVYNNIVSMIERGDFPIESWKAILDTYDSRLDQLREWMKSKEGEIKSKFIKKFIATINPKLSKPKSLDDLEALLHDTKLLVADPIINNISATAGSVAGMKIVTFMHVSRLYKAMLDDTESEFENVSETDFLEAVVYHELLHVVSDTDLMLYSKYIHKIEEKEGRPIVHSYRYNMSASQWCGVSVTGGKYKKFVWLNEAITESQATELTGRESTGYQTEIKLFKLISEKGLIPIDLKYFRDAYFEMKSSRDGGRSLEYWNELIKQIRIAYPHDEYFLNHLDDYIQKNGILKAIEIFEKWNPNKPTLLK